VIPVVEWCRVAERDHTRSRRQYAHTGHVKGVICVARAYYTLPVKYRVGVLLHEFGHLAGARDEMDADALAFKLFGVEVERADSVWGKDLEVVRGI